jgi:glycosyltransferase involved in cell wall biosynthesis
VARILFVNTRYRPPYFRGGVERYIHVVAKAFRRLGHESHIVALDEPLACESDVPRTFFRVPRIPLLRPLLFSWMGRRQWSSADAIVLQYTPFGSLMPGKKLICTVHTTGYGEAQALRQTTTQDRWRWWKRARRHIAAPFERRVFDRAQRIIAISDQIAFELVEAYAVPRDKIVVVGNGVDCDEFHPGSGRKGRTPLRVLYVGRLAPRKNVDVLISAVAKIKADLTVRIAGTGPELERLQAMADALGIRDRVSFLGFRAGQDLLAEYQWADVLVMPSSYEGMPLVALEAKAAGLPIIAANFPGAGQIIPQSSGWVLDDVTPDSLASTIDGLARNPSSLDEMGANARSHALADYSWDAVVARLATQYDAVLSRCANGSSAEAHAISPCGGAQIGSKT